MAKKPTLKSITSGYASGTQLEFNFDAIETAFENTLSLDGSTPNAMTADLDMNSNDILNVATLSVTGLTVNGVDVSTSVASAATSATAAAASATAAAASETNAAASAAAAQAVEDLLPDWQGAWLTATVYATGDLVREDGSTYICLAAHTSGTFSTDLSASKWELFAQKGAAGAGTGDMLAANNLSDVASAATSRSNLGLGSIATQDSTAVVVGSGGGSVTNSLTVTTAGHVTDGGNDYGVTIHSYEPALCLVDRTVSGGSALVWGTETGGLRIMGDTTQDGSIGQTANATDYDLVKFEKTTHTFYINGSSKMTLTSSGLAVGGVSVPTETEVDTLIDDSRTRYLHVRDEKSSGTDGGTATAGSYETRTLNTEVANTITGASLSSNQVTLPNGTYRFKANATGFWCGRFRAALYNVTDATYVLKGTASDSSDADEGQSAFVEGYLTVSGGPKVYELRSRCSRNNADDGFGRAASFGENEVYSSLIVEMLS